MQDFIKIKSKNIFLLNTDLLGLKDAQLWIGTRPDGPSDNDDKRVAEERSMEEAKKGEPDHRISGIEAVDLVQSENEPGWFEVDTSTWVPGIYRFNIHSQAGIKAPDGTDLRPIRDGQYSWPVFSDEYLQALSDYQKSFLYLEPNKAGFCIRIEIKPDREIKPAGDGVLWISKWPEINKITEEHYESKIAKSII